MTLFELARDDHDRPLLLVEDIQRWLIDTADYWQTEALTSFWNTAVYGHTSLILRGLAAQLDDITVVDLNA